MSIKIKFLLLLFCASISFGQTRSVAQKVMSLQTSNQKLTDYHLFTKSNDASKASKYLTSVSEVTVLELNQGELNRLINESADFIRMNIPYLDEAVEVVLYKQSVLSNTFFATDESGNLLDYTPGKYYRGIVNEDHHSLVAISFFENDVMGVISTPESGNLVMGKSVDKEDFIIYSDVNLLGENPFVCGVDELLHNQEMEQQINFDPNLQNLPQTTNCVKLYYEIAYAPFQMNGSNVQNTLNWITGIQNNIGTLYDNDDINLLLNEIRIWTHQDPYNGDFLDNLFLFQESVKDFEGDLAHLINYPSTTSVAFLNALCTDWNYAYSGVSMTYAEVPTYSWTIMAMAHEMGHSLGSPHTHACTWNGNGTPIDGCGDQAGYSEGCSGPIPSQGGTIMSYCHLLNVGINLSLGFGEQPSALIRNNIDSLFCLSSDCEQESSVCTYSIENITTQYLDAGGIQFTLSDSNSSAWKYQIIPFGTSLNPNNWVTTSSNSFIISELSEHQYYEFFVVNICENGDLGAMKRAIILPGDFCDGTLFVDTGGVSGNYSNNEYWSKTFYPADNNSRVRLSFNRIGLQPGSDQMYVYNGDSSSAPLFDGGMISGGHNPGPSFISTHPSGAITVLFISDALTNTYGWEATVECNALGTEDLKDVAGIKIFPNPTSDLLFLQSDKELIETVEIIDVSGKNVWNSRINGFNAEFSIQHLPKGVYIVNIKTKHQNLIKKIIKN